MTIVSSGIQRAEVGREERKEKGEKRGRDKKIHKGINFSAPTEIRSILILNYTLTVPCDQESPGPMTTLYSPNLDICGQVKILLCKVSLFFFLSLGVSMGKTVCRKDRKWN